MNEKRTEYILPPTEQAGIAFRRIIRRIRESGMPATLKLQPGKYVFSKADAAICGQPVSNTMDYTGRPVRKHIGILLENMADFTLDGNGGELIFCGDMSAIALLECRNIVLRGFSVDYRHPRVAEMRCVRSSDHEAEFAVHPDSRITVRNGNLFFLDPDGGEEAAQKRIVQCAAANGLSNLRSRFHPAAEAESCRKTDSGHVVFSYDKPAEIEPDSVWQFRNPVRNENGIFLHHCCNIELDHLKLRFTPGLGIVAQLCRDLNIHHHVHAPAPDSGRVCASFADCIQISCCRGKVRIADSRFSGAQDDPINIHGVYLGVVRQEERSLLLEFRHPQTWGFLPFEAGDEVALVNADSLERVERRRVTHARLIGFRQIELTLDSGFRLLNPAVRQVLENLSVSPEAVVENNHFSCYPTRGVLFSSSAPGRICGNIFNQTSPSPAILIEGDACSWYESGGVRDVMITGNNFRHCLRAAVEINPHILAEPRKAVHGTVAILDNSFEGPRPYVRCHSVEKLRTDLPESAIEPEVGKHP